MGTQSKENHALRMPYPPTDSLYKFCALAGTIILLGALYVPRQFVKRLEDEVDTLVLQAATLEIESQHVLSSLESIEEILSNSVAEQKGEYVHDPDKLELHYSEDELKSLIADAVRKFWELKEKKTEVEYLRKRAERLINEGKSLNALSYGCLAIGAILSVLGYSMWYSRIQKHQDLLLRSQLEERQSRTS
jgi:hypothetical protein